MDRRTFLRTSATLPLAATVSGCAADELLGTRNAVRVAVTWSGAELEAFRDVIDNLRGLDMTHLGLTRPMDYAVDLIPRGDSIAAAIGARGTVKPDVVMLPRPGLVNRYRDDLEALPREGNAQLSKRVWPHQDRWRQLLSDSDTGQMYGLPFKVAHKSAVWYRKQLFAEHGLTPPRSWWELLGLVDQLVRNDELRRAGIAPLALGAADGWVLTDVFENILLALHDDTYKLLLEFHPDPNSESVRRWNDHHVVEALVRLGRLWGRRGVLSGGLDRSLVSQYPDAVQEVFAYERAAMVVAPDFADLIIEERYGAEPSARRRDEVGVFQFPADSRSGPPPVLVGSDIAVLPAPASAPAKDFVMRLSHRGAALPWIHHARGFIAANPRTNARYSAQSARLARDLEELRDPETSTQEGEQRGRLAFDLSDQLEAVGDRDGLWRALDRFLLDIGDRYDEIDTSALRDIRAAAWKVINHLIEFERERL